MNILKSVASNVKKSSSIIKNIYCTSVGEIPQIISSSNSPIIRSYKYEHLRLTSENPRQAWIDNLDTIKEEKLGLVTLHPDIFSVVPRLDIIHENVVWQDKYKFVNMRHAKTPPEMRGPGRGLGRKPWPQKGTGRARQGSTRAPQWKKGGTVHGPRMFTTKFYMLPYPKRVMGLISTLSIKLSQDDLKIVSSLDIPSDEPKYLEDLFEERNWGPSVLFVDSEDIMPQNIALASDEILHINLLPVYGLNVHSMLKHDTLVLTISALEKIQEKLIHSLHRPDSLQKCNKKYVH